MEKHTKYPDKQLITVLVISAAPDAEIATQLSDAINELVAEYHGQLTTCSRLLTASFEGPSSAVYCGLEVIKQAAYIPHTLGVGVHTLEVSAYEELRASDETCNLIDAFRDKIAYGQVLVTHTVKQLISGSELLFAEKELSFIFLSDQRLSLFAVSDADTLNDQGSYQEQKVETLMISILQTIHQYMDTDIGVEKLCEVVGISRRHLQRRLKTITNKSPGQFINFVKLHHAKELLLKQDSSISDVAFRVGLSPSYFSKKFKEEFGVSPSEVISKDNSREGSEGNSSMSQIYKALSEMR